ncbi:MAG: ATP-binding cassette domain-containing protein, partial [Phycisphaerae bacterium]|nr:ATP-binding cassette domain-containing protein [Phycisphaerae bacterium]
AVAGAFTPELGRIWIDDIEVTARPEHARARWIGRVFQDPFAGSAPSLTVAENLALAERRGQWRGLRPLIRTGARARWRDALAQIGLGLESRLDDPIGLLSGGQRQAITLVMASLARPRLLLLDEHTAALDPRSAELVIALTRRIIERDGLTALMVTHSMSQAASLGDRLIAMHRGRPWLDVQGNAKRAWRAERLHELFSDMRREDRFDDATVAVVVPAYR